MCKPTQEEAPAPDPLPPVNPMRIGMRRKLIQAYRLLNQAKLALWLFAIVQSVVLLLSLHLKRVDTALITLPYFWIIFGHRPGSIALRFGYIIGYDVFVQMCSLLTQSPVWDMWLVIKIPFWYMFYLGYQAALTVNGLSPLFRPPGAQVKDIPSGNPKARRA